MDSEQPPVHVREVTAGGQQNGFDLYLEVGLGISDVFIDWHHDTCSRL